MFIGFGTQPAQFWATIGPPEKHFTSGPCLDVNWEHGFSCINRDLANINVLKNHVCYNCINK